MGNFQIPYTIIFSNFSSINYYNLWAKTFKKFKNEFVLKIYRLLFPMQELSGATIHKEKLQSNSASGMSKGTHRSPFVEQ